ncbi:spermatogenesis- and oogenesis-specific basic helix-loop-helix-containing protein 1 [Meles meles]|uniref:spermatogenesis- and oogenesis-specific basic helix-loop-helix-containing protein 1 n=1 Tax=Meles meles TaxID=9662 RepID=UPI001E69A3A0|nr:spermatogenesis- and oogenesis-specific basic helix-loop-helix-containing protein 1 [Meles meles]
MAGEGAGGAARGAGAHVSGRSRPDACAGAGRVVASLQLRSWRPAALGLRLGGAGPLGPGGLFRGSRSSTLLSVPGSASSPSSVQGCSEDYGQAARLVRVPPERPGSGFGSSLGLPRNVLSERERRKRISVSCERLRALLPRFDGRREDMASVLEMAVQFLRLAGTLLPSQEPHPVLGPSREVWREWPTDVLPQGLSREGAAGSPDCGTGASGLTVPPAAVSCGTAGAGEDEALRGAAEVVEGPPVLPEPCSLLSQPPGPSPSEVLRPPPLWPPRAWQPPSPLVSEEAPICLGRAGPPADGADHVGTLDTRPVLGCDVEDGASCLLNAGPDWWLGSVEGRGARAPSRSAVRSSLLDRAEPGFPTDPEPGLHELPDGPLEPWGSDAGCPSLALREEMDSIFPDFFPG